MKARVLLADDERNLRELYVADLVGVSCPE